jgi:membrane-associated phospholipid phosphatase
MHELLFQIDWITAVRSEGLTLFFGSITHLGGAPLGIVLLGLGLALGPRRIFGRLVAISLISQILNAHLKAFYMLPRPDEIYHLTDVIESSFPSGHAQQATVLWLWLAREIGRPWAWLVGSFIVIGVATSRVYLGVHFGRDVVGGAITGALVLVYFRWLTSQEGSPSRKQVVLQLTLLAVTQLAWIGLLVDAPRGLFLPTVIFFGFWLGLFLRQNVSSLNPLDKRWAVGWSLLVVAIALPPLFTAGASWFGPFGLGTHSAAVHAQFALLGSWLAVAAPPSLEILKKP